MHRRSKYSSADLAIVQVIQEEETKGSDGSSLKNSFVFVEKPFIFLHNKSIIFQSIVLLKLVQEISCFAI